MIAPRVRRRLLFRVALLVAWLVAEGAGAPGGRPVDWGCRRGGAPGGNDRPGANLVGPSRSLLAATGKAHTRQLLDSSADASVALLLAARDGALQNVTRILDGGVADIEFRDADGYTPLIWASTIGHLKVVNLLIRSGADVDAATIKGFTSLSEAALMGHAPVVKALVRNGADVQHKDVRGYTPLHEAVDEGHTDVVRFLLASGADAESQVLFKGETPLHLAAETGAVDIVLLLIDHGVNVSLPDFNGALPFHFATVPATWKPICEALLATGADINAVDNSGDTPLEYASWTGNFDAVRWLLAHGGDDSVVDARGKLAWQEVCGCLSGELYTIGCFPRSCQDHDENNEIRVLLGGVRVDPPDAPGAECQSLPDDEKIECYRSLQGPGNG